MEGIANSPGRDGSRLSALGQVFRQDGHLEHERAIAVLVFEHHADELFADVDLSGILLLWTRRERNTGVRKGPPKVALDLPDHSFVHANSLLKAQPSGNLAGRDGYENLR